MTASVVAIISTLVGFVVWLWKRKSAADDKPTTALKKYEDEARKIIAERGNVNALIDERMRAIARNTGGQDNNVDGAGHKSPAQWLPRPASSDVGNTGPAGKP